MKTDHRLRIFARMFALGIAFSCSLFAQGDFGYVLTGTNNSIAQINLTTRTMSGTIAMSGYATSCTLNQRGTKLWINAGSYFIVINTQTKTTEFTSLSYSGIISKPVFSRDGAKVYILNYSYPTTLLVFDTASYATSTSVALTGTSSWRSAPVISKDGNHLYFIDNDSYINEVNTTTFAVRRVSTSSYYNNVKLSPDDSLLTMWCSNQSSMSIQMMKASSLTNFVTVIPYTYLTNLEFSRDGKTLFAGLSSTAMLQKFNLSALPAVTSSYLSLPNYCFDAALDPSDTLMYLTYGGVYASNNIGIYNINADKLIGTLSVPNYPMNLTMPTHKDTVAPAAVSNFTATFLEYNSIRLVFTSPGNDGMAGRAALYDIRYDTVQITDSTFKRAAKVIGIHSPKNAGMQDTIDVAGLKERTRYYFAIKAGDEVLNYSPMATANAKTPAPARVAYQLDPITRVVKDNDSLSLTLKIQNTGDATLSYHIPLVYIAEAADGATAASSGVNVLIMYAGSTAGAADVRQKLLDEGGFSNVDLFSVSSSIPSLTELKRYDVVFVYASEYMYYPSEMGNVLADYMDAGGNVVTALRASSTSGPAIQGRFNAKNYWAIEPGAVTSSSQATLGIVDKPWHPIMKGVKTFDGGFSLSSGSYRIAGGAVASGASVVASWSDGAVLVAVKTIKGSNRVDLNFLPLSSDLSSGYWVSSTDGAKLMANALKFSAHSNGSYAGDQAVITLSSDSGAVKGGETGFVTVTLKTKNCRPGGYNLVIGLGSSDPDSAYVEAATGYSVRDLTPPAIGIRFFQNEAFPQNVSIVSVAHEKLYLPVMKAGVGTDSLEQAPVLIDTSNFVYNADYKLTKSGILTVRWQASDSIGNRSVTTRALAAQQVSSNASAIIASPDNRATMRLQPDAGAGSVFVTAAVDEDRAEADCMGPVYRFSPRSLTLSAPADLSIGFAGVAGGEACSHFGIYAKAANGEWVYVPTRLDAKAQAVHARVSALGEFRIMNNPSVEPEEYIEALPTVFALEQNYPNPFNPSTTLRYELPEPGMVRLAVFDAIGREVSTLVNEVKQAGYYTVEFNAARLSSGVYFACLTSGGKVQMKKLVLMK